jgi:glycerol-3-phosphate dehydrogenase (NAD(P)+)
MVASAHAPSLAVIGAGAWGTALACVAARAGRQVAVIARNAAVVDAINRDRANPRALPGLPLPEGIVATTDPAPVETADWVLVVVPAQASRGVLAGLAPRIRRGTRVISAAKGFERTTLDLMTDVIAELVPQAVPAVLSGPSFATDVARGLPTAVTVAANAIADAEAIAQALSSSSFRCYASDDPVGVQVGGALKNVLAIAAGIVVGRALGASAQAALTARGFAELSRLGAAMRARPETLMGLSGLGDLVLTASSRQSRNFSLGIALGEGQTPAALLAAGALAEGASTASVAVDLAARFGVDVPISRAVAQVLAGAWTIDATIADLMSRPLRRE